MHTNQTSQSAVYVPEHQADSAAVVGFVWADCEAGIVTGEMEPGRLLSEVRSLGVFFWRSTRKVKPLGYVFVSFSARPGIFDFCENVKPRLEHVIGRFFGETDPPQKRET